MTLLQFAEGLADRQTADAVRSRIDWKYALGLPLDDPGFDASVLSEFRSRLISGNAEDLPLNTLLTVFKDRGFLKARGRQRTDSTHVVAALRVLNRLECVGETLTHALNSLTIVAPDWVSGHCAAIGRDPATIERSVQPRVDPSDWPATRALVQSYIAVGATHITLGLLPPYPALQEVASELIVPLREQHG